MLFRLSPSVLVLPIACLLLGAQVAAGAVHYFLLQGNFDVSTTAVETYKFKITDSNSVLQSGQSLMDTVFGTPSRVGTSNIYTTSGSGFDISYTYYSSFDSFLINSIKLTGTDDLLATNVGAGLSWNYYVSGGSYIDAYPPPEYAGPESGPYEDGEWTMAYTGQPQRSLLDTDGDGVADATFDGWVFGSDGYYDGIPEPPPAATIGGADNAPIEGFFTGPGTSVDYGNGITVFSYSAVPEPAHALLVTLGLVVVGLRRRRTGLV
jgi:hypothetical protein